jgi:hypothetical protein
VRVRSVASPGGESYDVLVEWLPRWRFLAGRFSRWRRRRRDDGADGTGWLDALDIPFSLDVDDLLVGLALLVAFIVGVAVFWWVVLPALLLFLDGLVVVVLLLVGLVARVLLRRPWTVLVHRVGPPQASDGGVADTTVQVIGWRRALRTRDSIADALASGASVVVATAAPPS